MSSWSSSNWPLDAVTIKRRNKQLVVRLLHVQHTYYTAHVNYYITTTTMIGWHHSHLTRWRQQQQQLSRVRESTLPRATIKVNCQGRRSRSKYYRNAITSIYSPHSQHIFLYTVNINFTSVVFFGFWADRQRETERQTDTDTQTHRQTLLKPHLQCNA